MEIREYKPDDLMSLIELFGRSVHEVACRDYTPTQVKTWAPDAPDIDAWKERLSRGLVWVSEASGTILGFVRLEQRGYIDLLYVHPEVQRQGVATRLLDVVLQWARQHHLPRLSTDASISARPFFEHNAFRVIRPQQVTLSDVRFDNFVMERVL